MVALGEDVAEAADRAYAAADMIDFAGKQMRRDVAATGRPPAGVKRIAILASGSGTNAQALLDAARTRRD